VTVAGPPTPYRWPVRVPSAGPCPEHAVVNPARHTAARVRPVRGILTSLGRDAHAAGFQAVYYYDHLHIKQKRTSTVYGGNECSCKLGSAWPLGQAADPQTPGGTRSAPPRVPVFSARGDWSGTRARLAQPGDDNSTGSYRVCCDRARSRVNDGIIIPIGFRCCFVAAAKVVRPLPIEVSGQRQADAANV
jgi:hypothetical protein